MPDENKVKWTVDLITKLQNAKIGDPGRLASIKDALENGRAIYQSDKNYLKEKFEQLDSSEQGTIGESSDDSKAGKALFVISKLQEAELGNQGRLSSLKALLENNQPISEEDSNYLLEKYNQLLKIDTTESKTLNSLDMIKKLREAEIGSSERLDSIQKSLRERIELSQEDENYLAEKLQQYHKIQGTESIPQARKIESTKPVTLKKIVKKQPRPVDPDAKFCAYCQRLMRPERDFSVGALVVLLLIGIIPGLIYYFLKAPVCPICKHSQWQIPPDEEEQ